MFNLIKIVAKIALQNPKIRNEIKNTGLKTYKKAKPIINQKLNVLKKTANQVSPIKDPKKFGEKLIKNLKN